jgi:hypothetical protein
MFFSFKCFNLIRLNAINLFDLAIKLHKLSFNRYREKDLITIVKAFKFHIFLSKYIDQKTKL